MLEIANLNTKYRKRYKELKIKFACLEIRDMLDKAWQKGMAEKKTLSRYREYKEVRGTIEHLYDNTKGSRLLADARAGCLQTRKYRSRFSNIGTACPKCGEEETLEHVILECKKPLDAEYTIRKRIGLHKDSNTRRILPTKRVLEEWDRNRFPPKE